MANKFHPLLKKNPVAIKNGLVDILDSISIDKIQQEIDNHVIDLFKLGLNHYQFATKTDATDWRHRVSRFYYASYNIARAIRLHYDGVYSTESEDHKKVGDLPDDFPNKEDYKYPLSYLREDRNKADYDHLVTEQDLVLGVENSASLVGNLIRDAKLYLQTKASITI